MFVFVRRDVRSELRAALFLERLERVERHRVRGAVRVFLSLRQTSHLRLDARVVALGV
jgi:hypothetical protein